MYVCVYGCVRLGVFVCECIWMWGGMYMHMHVCMGVYVCFCIHMCVFIYVLVGGQELAGYEAI